MKNVILFILLSMTFVSCSSKFSSNESSNMTLGTPEQNFKSKLSGTWTNCESQNGKYTQYILKTGANEITISARAYKLPDCKGDTYESYNLAKLTSKIQKTESSTGGLLALTYNIYYPVTNLEHKEIENGYTRIDNRVILSSDGVVAVSETELMITLINITSVQNIEGSSNTKEKTQTVTHKFVRQNVNNEEMYLNVKTHYSFEDSQLITVKSSNEAQSYLLENTKSLIDPNCITEYFSKSTFNSELQPAINDADGVFLSRKDHLDLTLQGLTINLIQFQAVTDKLHRQFIVMKLYYDGGSEESSLSCLNLLRSKGIELEQK